GDVLGGAGVEVPLVRRIDGVVLVGRLGDCDSIAGAGHGDREGAGGERGGTCGGAAHLEGLNQQPGGTMTRRLGLARAWDESMEQPTEHERGLQSRDTARPAPLLNKSCSPAQVIEWEKEMSSLPGE